MSKKSLYPAGTPRARPRQIESGEQKALIRWCAVHAPKYPALELIFAIPNGGRRDAITGQRLKEEGVKPGVPDLFLAQPKLGSQWPHKKAKYGLFIELKSATGTIRDNQKKWIAQLSHVGYQVEACYSWVEAVHVIIDYLGLPEGLGVR